MPRSEGSGIRGVIRVTMVVLALWAHPAGAQERSGSTADGKSGFSSDGAVSTALVAASKFASTTCVDGSAAGHSCSGIDLVSFVPRSDLGAASNIRLNDIWGWTDPVDGTEYALVGREDGVAFVDISAPASPRYVGELLLHPGNVPQVWRDFKVYRNHLFVVADGRGSDTHGMQVFYLTRLRSATGGPVVFDEDAHYDGVGSAHNIAIDEASGHAFIVGFSSGDRCGSGLHIVDVSNPTDPVFVGCFRDSATTYGYTHDVQCVTYHGPDARYTGREICVGSNVDAVVVADVTDKQNAVTLGAGRYPQSRYIHQGWFTEDHRYFIQDDELDERSYGHGARTRIWDMAELDDPVLIATHEFTGPSIDHNLFVDGHLVFAANYASGLRVLDISDVRDPRETAWFDTYPLNDATTFNGAWGSYPWFESGNVVVSSRDEGLFVVRLHDARRVAVTDIIVELHPASDVRLGDRLDARVAFDVLGASAAEAIEVTVEGHPSLNAAPYDARAGKTSFEATLTGLTAGIHRVEIVAVGKDGTRAVVGASSVVIVPDTHTLSNPAPNPAASRTSVFLAVREAQAVRAALFDVSGREITIVFDGDMPAGTGVEIDIDTSVLSAGSYYLRVVGKGFSDSRRIAVVN